jgi:hypothetical protein
VCDDIIGEVGIAESWMRADEPFTFKAGEALFDIGGILRAALLAVVDHVQANGDLLLHDIGHRSADTHGKGVPVEWTALLSVTQQLLEFPRAGQTSGVGREYA